MKRATYYGIVIIFCMLVMLLTKNMADADDTCMFMSTANDVPPNIVFLLDNGAEMEQIIWHPAYDNTVDYTPDPNTEVEFINGFFNTNGYTIVKKNANIYYIRQILDDLLPDTTGGCENSVSGSSTFTINGRTVTLPALPSMDAVDGVIDNAAMFRYSKNYLNWIFFSGADIGDGSDLPAKSRFYNAKKALMTVAKLTANRAKFAIYNFANDAGASNVQPLGNVVKTPLAALPENNILEENYVNNINNMGTVTYSPLAEGLATVGGYFASPSSGVVGEYCQKNFAVVVSPGISSQDLDPISQSCPSSFSDYDGDDSGGIGEGNIKVDSTTYTIPINLNGSTWLDDVAYYLYDNDIVGYQDGFQNVLTYTIGFLASLESNLYLKNTSNNGNGNFNLYDSSDPDYGRYHFEAESPENLSSVIIAAINDIILKTAIFVSPVVPVSRTMSDNKIYMAFFRPNEGNFWEGNLVKFGISSDNKITDCNGNPATWPNGALREDAEPYWATQHWADFSKSNYIHNSSRNIYTHIGPADLTDPNNEFSSSNSKLTSSRLGNPSTPIEKIINYIRGADVFDEDDDGDITENRGIITGDVLHSTPVIIRYNSSSTMVYFGSNDGALHAVRDDDGTESWAYIPHDQLSNLKDMVEGSSHRYFVDSSPTVYLNDLNGDGDINAEESDQAILISGQRKGGTGYFALDITNPEAPLFLWTFDQSDDAELGESWSEPEFGWVKTFDGDTTGTPVAFIGGGYSVNNVKGKAIFVINVISGAIVAKYSAVTGMDYSFPGTLKVMDYNNNGFIDKVYGGDCGGQLWRLGKFSDEGVPFAFPQCDENIMNWSAQVILDGDPAHAIKFFYPPCVTLEKGYDLVFVGSGDREDACATTSADRIYCIKDTHANITLEETDLVDVTNPSATPPDLDNPGDVDFNGNIDQGWYIQFTDSFGNGTGEKVLAEGIVFNKVFYVTTFTPNDDVCLPGGFGELYALDYKTGQAVLKFGNEVKTRSMQVGGGIPSEPVVILTETGQKIFISVGSTNTDFESDSIGAGIIDIDLTPLPLNFFFLWWREITP
ncbi:MAG: pilus assembly protein [bacterium]